MPGAGRAPELIEWARARVTHGWHPESELLRRLAHEVALADFDADTAQDRVGGRHVEIEIRLREVQEIGAAAFERPGILPEGQRDLLVAVGLEHRRNHGRDVDGDDMGPR